MLVGGAGGVGGADGVGGTGGVGGVDCAGAKQVSHLKYSGL